MQYKFNLETTLDTLYQARTVGTPALVEYFLKLSETEGSKVFHQLPDTYQKELCSALSDEQITHLVNQMRTDDATDVMIMLKEIDEVKWLNVIEQMDAGLKEAVKSLMDYSENESGSLMELEVFTVNKREKVGESLKRLKHLLDTGALKNIHNIFIVDTQHHLKGLLALEKIVTVDPQLTYNEIYDKETQPLSVHSRASVEEAIRLMERYDLGVLPVINKNGRLLGRITHDDILDLIQEKATRQIYSLNQVHPEEEIEEHLFVTGKSRGFWLLINLFNAVLVSVVISFFEHSLQSVVALAVLMPIVANMAGTASMQTVTVMVRQMALGNLSLKEGSPTLFKEIKLSLLNGVVFALLATVVSYVWFASVAIGLVMAVSMLVTFLFAGILGAYVPVLLKSFKIDPAVASSVIVITLVDVIGFFSFLWFATMWVPEISGG